MNAFNQTKKIVFVEDRSITFLRIKNRAHNYLSFRLWFVAHCKKLFLNRYNSYIVCQMEIDEQKTLYTLVP